MVHQEEYDPTIKQTKILMVFSFSCAYKDTCDSTSLYVSTVHVPWDSRMHRVRTQEHSYVFQMVQREEKYRNARVNYSSKHPLLLN